MPSSIIRVAPLGARAGRFDVEERQRQFGERLKKRKRHAATSVRRGSRKVVQRFRTLLHLHADDRGLKDDCAVNDALGVAANTTMSLGDVLSQH